MKYDSKCSSVEAERLTLAGQPMVAVALDGKGHLLSAEVFDLFFSAGGDLYQNHAANGTPKYQTTERKPAPAKKPTAQKNPAQRSTELRGQITSLLAGAGPLTTAEVGDDLYPNQPNAKLRGQAAALKKMHEDGLVHRVEHSGIDKWALKVKTA